MTKGFEFFSELPRGLVQCGDCEEVAGRYGAPYERDGLTEERGRLDAQKLNLDLPRNLVQCADEADVGAFAVGRYRGPWISRAEAERRSTCRALYSRALEDLPRGLVQCSDGSEALGAFAVGSFPAPAAAASWYAARRAAAVAFKAVLAELPRGLVQCSDGGDDVGAFAVGSYPSLPGLDEEAEARRLTSSRFGAVLDELPRGLVQCSHGGDDVGAFAVGSYRPPYPTAADGPSAETLERATRLDTARVLSLRAKVLADLPRNLVDNLDVDDVGCFAVGAYPPPLRRETASSLAGLFQSTLPKPWPTVDASAATRPLRNAKSCFELAELDESGGGGGDDDDDDDKGQTANLKKRALYGSPTSIIACSASFDDLLKLAPL